MATIISAKKWSHEGRGSTQIGWLNGKHSFSFGRFYDPTRMGVGPLRVINDDVVAPSGGFPTHPHDNMEIFTYVLSGRLAHTDSTGTAQEIERGTLQFMSAGSGITHSEFNPSDTDPVHLLQIWIEPAVQNTPPRYADRRWDDSEKEGRSLLMLSPDGRDGSMTIGQDALVYASIVRPGDQIQVAVDEGRIGFLHVATGEVVVNGETLLAGDGFEWNGGAFAISTESKGEVLFFDLPRNS